jgi:hypothetical protein
MDRPDMRVRYIIHPGEGYIDSVFEGSVTLSELGAYVQRVWSDPAWRPEFSGLMDFSGATIDLSDADIGTLMKSMLSDPRCSFARWAFVVKTAADFGRLRKVDALVDREATLRIFFSRNDAEQWLLSPRKES